MVFSRKLTFQRVYLFWICANKEDLIEDILFFFELESDTSEIICTKYIHFQTMTYSGKLL